MLDDIQSFTQLLEASDIVPVFVRNGEPERYKYRHKSGCFDCDHDVSMSPNNIYHTVGILNEATGYFAGGFIYSPMDIGWENRVADGNTFEALLDSLNDRRFYSFVNDWDGQTLFIRAYANSYRDPLMHVNARVRFHDIVRGARHLSIVKRSASVRGVYWNLSSVSSGTMFKLVPEQANKLLYAASQEAGQAELDMIPGRTSLLDMTRLRTKPLKKVKPDPNFARNIGQLDANMISVLRLVARGDRVRLSPGGRNLVYSIFPEQLFRAERMMNSRNYHLWARDPDTFSALLDDVIMNGQNAMQAIAEDWDIEDERDE